MEYAYENDEEYKRTTVKSTVPPPHIKILQNGRVISYRPADTVQIIQSANYLSNHSPSFSPDAFIVETQETLDLDTFSISSIINDLTNKQNSITQTSQIQNRSSPYSLLRKAPYKLFPHPENAFKIANLDVYCELLAFRPIDREFKFVDIYDDTLGCSEYISWRLLQKRIPFKGIALTPLDRHSCAIKDVNVVVGVDICVESGREKIAESVGNADLVVAHLGVEGQRFKKTLVCELITMFKIIGPNGDFLCKFFDTHTNFYAHIIFILYKSFDKISLIKPLATKPSEPEKFIICKGFKGVPDRLSGHLSAVESCSEEVYGIFTTDYIEKHEEFVDWLQGLNIKAIVKQIEAISEIEKHNKNPNEAIYQQEEIKNMCLAQWDLPVFLPTIERPPQASDLRGNNRHHPYSRDTKRDNRNKR